MAWYLLILAGLFEIAWAVGLSYTDGFSDPLSTAGTVIALVASFLLLGKAIQTLPVGTAYAVWTGIGIVGTAAFGIVLFDESTDLVRLICIMLIVLGVVGLHTTATSH